MVPQSVHKLLDTTIGKRGYTPGICEMTAMSQLYTRKLSDNLLGIQKIWYMSGIYLFIPDIYQLHRLFEESLTFILKKI